MNFFYDSNEFKIFEREFVKDKLITLLKKNFDEFLDHKKISQNNEKIFFPIKDNCDLDKLSNQAILAKKEIRKFFYDNHYITEKVKKNFSNFLNVDNDIVKLSDYVSISPRINVPGLDRILNWHQDTGTWYDIDINYPEKQVNKNSWKKIIYIVWISLCDCNEKNGLEIIPESYKYGLQNAKHFTDKFFGKPLQFSESVITKKINNLNHLFITPKAGYGHFFNSLTFHRSMKNKSDEIRLSVDFRFEVENTKLIDDFGISKKIIIKRFFYKNFPFFTRFWSLPKQIPGLPKKIYLKLFKFLKLLVR